MKKSENAGSVIAITVIAVISAAIGIWYLLRWIVKFFSDTFKKDRTAIE